MSDHGCVSLNVTVREGGPDAPDLCQLEFRNAFGPKGLSEGGRGKVGALADSEGALDGPRKSSL